MGGFQHVAAEVVVGEDRAAYRADADGVVQQSQFHQGFGHQLMDNAVIAAGAVVQFTVGQSGGLLIYNRHVT